MNFVSLQTQAAAMAIAQIALKSAKKQNLLNDFIGKIKDQNANN